MILRPILLILSITFLYSYENNIHLLSDIFKKENWIEVNKHSDSLVVYKKKLDKIPIPAFKATMTTSVPMEYVISAILDGDNHEKFMGTSHVIESEFVGPVLEDTTFIYQMLDLPIISDRHYITKNFIDIVVPNNHYRLNWMIDDSLNQSIFSDLIKEKNTKYNKPIFMKDGVGSWELQLLEGNITSVSYIVLTDPGGWIPNQIVSYVNQILGPDTVLMMVKEGRKRYENKK